MHRIDLTIAVYGGTCLITRLERVGVATQAMREGKRRRTYAVFIYKRLCALMTGVNDIGTGEK
jgi:predicted DNA repair protein MutK